MNASMENLPIGESCLLNRGRTQIEYFKRGADEHPAIVLLPGLGRSVNEFNALTTELIQNEFRTVAIQTRGVGRSQARIFPRASLEDLAEDACAVIRDLGLESVHLVGRALGNRLARVIGWKHPHLTRSLTLICAGGRVPSSKRVGLSYFISSKARNQLLCAAGNHIPAELDCAPSIRALIRQLPAVKRPPKGDWWLGGEAPMLVIQGAEDQLAPPENGIELKQAAPERVQLHTLDNAGHMVLAERFPKVFELMIEFLTSIQQEFPADFRSPSG